MGRIFLPAENRVFLNIALMGHPVSHHPVKVGNHQIALIFPGSAHQHGSGIRGNPVIAVQELQIHALRLRQSQIPGGGDTAVFLMQYPHPCIPLGKGVTQRTGGILAAVVNEQQLKILKILSQDTLHTPLNGFFRIVYGNNDADDRTAHIRPPLITARPGSGPGRR